MSNYQESDYRRGCFAGVMGLALLAASGYAVTEQLIRQLAASMRPRSGELRPQPPLMDQPHAPTPRAGITPSISEIVNDAEQRLWPTAVMAPQPKDPSTGTSESTPLLSPAPGR